jgi:ferredoxin
MAIKITEECINCGACEPECPNNAIYEGGVEWAITDGTSVKGQFTLLDGSVVDASQRNAPVSVDIYYITPNKCTECQGFHEEPQCAAVCPVDCCVPDEMYKETVEELLAKKGAPAYLGGCPMCGNKICWSRKNRYLNEVLSCLPM